MNPVTVADHNDVQIMYKYQRNFPQLIIQHFKFYHSLPVEKCLLNTGFSTKFIDSMKSQLSDTYLFQNQFL